MFRAAIAALVVAIQLPVGSAVAAGSGSPEPRADAFADFDGDGYHDLAIGVPTEDIGSATDAGAVNVLYGSSTGLTAAGDQVWHMGVVVPGGVPRDGDHFGEAVAWGDFDGDSYDDLAVGAPFNDDVENAEGFVTVLYGSDSGLTAEGSWIVRGNLAGRFGFALAAANFGNGPEADLAIGAPDHRASGPSPETGAVWVFYGSPDGLGGGDPLTLLYQDGYLGDEREVGDALGSSLAAANLGKGDQADLAIGVPGEDLGSIANAGAAHVVYGTGANGLGAPGSFPESQFWHQDRGIVDNVAGSAEANDRFGFALAARNFGNETPADLAVGVPYEDHSGANNAGVVNVLYGATNGLAVASNHLVSQTVGIVESGDLFGYSLAAANFGNGSEADLAIGAPLENLSLTDVGSVNVAYGSPSGLGCGCRFLTQNTEGVNNDAEMGDQFGYALAGANFGSGGQADLAVGVPREDLFSPSTNSQHGAVNVLYGSPSGVDPSTGSQFWSQQTTGVGGVPEDGDRLGSALS